MLVDLIEQACLSYIVFRRRAEFIDGPIEPKPERTIWHWASEEPSILCKNWLGETRTKRNYTTLETSQCDEHRRWIIFGKYWRAAWPRYKLIHIQVEVNDSYNGGRPNLTIDEEDADAFDGFTYVGGLNTTSPRNAIKTTPKAEEPKKEEVKAEVVVLETKHEEVKVEEPKTDPALQIKIEGNNNNNTEIHRPVEEKQISPKLEIVAEELLSPKSVTSEEDDESESSDEDSESSDSEYESKDESSSDDDINRGPFIVRLPGQQ